MIKNLKFLLLTVFLPTTVISLNCTVCEFALLPPHSTNCQETCEGDVCFIVVNKFFNGTINAGCMHLHDGDSFEDKAICQRGKYDNRCACSTTDNCNNPKVKINSYVFTESPVLEGYQWLPQIQPPMPSLQPIVPPVDVPIDGMNETVTQLENGVENDLLNNLDDRPNTTNVLRNEENDDDELLTVTTTVGLNIRDQTRRSEVNDNHVETSTKSFSPGQGSVEVTKVNQEASIAPPRLESPTRPRNVTTSDGPNSSDYSQFLFAICVPLLLQKLL